MTYTICPRCNKKMAFEKWEGDFYCAKCSTYWSDNGPLMQSKTLSWHPFNNNFVIEWIVFNYNTSSQVAINYKFYHNLNLQNFPPTIDINKLEKLLALLC